MPADLARLRALRAKAMERGPMVVDAAGEAAALYVWTLCREAPGLLDEVEALRARVAELERECWQRKRGMRRC